jgi:DNA-binding response OmpR family regulator
VRRSSVLLVEDDDDVRLLAGAVLKRGGLTVHAVATGAEAMRAVFALRPDLVVLDIGLPEVDGWEVLRRLREASDVPVLVLTALGAETDKVRALRGGADDHLTKPFGRLELLARAEALLRRASAVPARPGLEEVHDDGTIRLDLVTHDVRVLGRPLSLTPLELRLLRALVRHSGQVLAPDQLLELCWDDPTGLGRDRVKVTIGYLRRKLTAAADCDPIETVRGFGYRYRPVTAP